MWRVVIASLMIAGCSDPVTYEVGLTIMQPPTARIVIEDRLYQMHTDTYEVADYDELRDVAVSVTVRDNDVDNYVVLPFAASACGSEEWVHSGELVHIAVHYSIVFSGAEYLAYADYLRCVDDADEARTVINN